MVTILRLPNMDIVLSSEEERERQMEEGEREEWAPRRSRRLSGKETKKISHSYNLKKRKERRLRHNSAMEEEYEEDEEENEQIMNIDVEEEKEENIFESTRKEPEHRRLNRMRLSQTEQLVEKSPEETANFGGIINHEKTFVESLLQKYGFGHWNIFSEDNNTKISCDNT